MKPWLLYLWSLSIFTCTFTPLHIALFGHCWFTCDHCLGDLNARSCCLTTPGLLSLDTCNVMSYVICHTYLKLVQMISWSRCVSACDCVMTGCCNILSPFISRRISDTSHRSGPLSARARPGVAGPRAVRRSGHRRARSIPFTTSLLTRWLIVRSPFVLIGRTLAMCCGGSIMSNNSISSPLTWIIDRLLELFHTSI